MVLDTVTSLDVVGKPATQSSTRAAAGNAVDGDFTTHSHTGITTAGKTNPWWMLDLEAVYCLRTITIYNRYDCNGCSGRLKGALVRAGLDPDRVSNTVIGTVTHGQTRDGRVPIVITADLVVNARYVSVDLPGTNKILNMREVMVNKGRVTTLDVVGKPATQSSTASSGAAGRAADGDFSTFSHTEHRTVAGKTDPWWRLDLQAVYCLQTITIYNQLGDCGDSKCALRLTAAIVRAGLNPDRVSNRVMGTVTSEQASDGNVPIVITADPVVTARYVSVDLQGNEKYLHMREVKVEKKEEDVDFTLVTNPALLGQTGDGDVIIAAYKGPNDISADVSFGRQVTTGGSHVLPSGSLQDPQLGCQAITQLNLPEEGGLDRTGVFYCEASQPGRTDTRIQTIILPKDESTVRIRPVQRTQTANVGDSVQLEMQNVNAPNTNYRWKHNGGNITSWNDQLSVSIDDVAMSDGGVYSCFALGQEGRQLHGIMRLIVRGCPAGMWGQPSCMNVCQRCYNGGVCEPNSGNCICAPGFSGENCEQVHGRNVFGQNAGHNCSNTTDPHDDACRGRLFCLPDPYGCSCAAGFMGLDCMQECSEGKYGADCKQTCHCAAGVTCKRDTGECINEACNSSHFGNNCQCSKQDSFPGQVVTASVMQRNATLFWRKVTCQDSDFQGYRYQLTNAITGATVTTNDTTDVWTTIAGLTPYVEYNFQVAFYSTLSTGIFSRILTFRTAEAEPTAPLYLSIPTADNQSITIAWRKPDPPQGNITNYDVAYWIVGNETTRVENLNLSTTMLSLQISGLVVNVTYSMQVRAKTLVGVGPWSDVINETVVGVPGLVQNLELAERKETSLTITWEQPLKTMAPSTDYLVELRVLEKPYDLAFTAEDGYTKDEVDSSPYTIENLAPGTKYKIRVSAKNHRFTGMPSVLEVNTKPLPDPPAPTTPMTYDNEATESTVTLGLGGVLPEDDTFVVSYIVNVKKTGSLSRKKREALTLNHFEDMQDDYIAADVTKTNVPDKFVVGDGEMYGGYFNAPLQPNAAYSIRVGSVSKGNDTEISVTYSDAITANTTPEGGNQAGVAAGVVIPVLVLIAIVIGVILYRRRRSDAKDPSYVNRVTTMSQLEDDIKQDGPSGTSNPYSASEEEPSSCPPTPAVADKPAPPPSKPKPFKEPSPVRIEDLADYIKKREAEGKEWFVADYKTLPDGQLHPWTVASKPENKKKNRFANVIPYDHSRVVLTPEEQDPHSDYINACYIDGYGQTDKYIASQGPNQASLKDIWRMVWQMNVDKIVMLTNPVENGKKKCLQYWPDNGATSYANFTVMLVKEQIFLHHTIRQFKLTELDDDDSLRFVKQFHYTTWPDMKPPEYPAPLLNFMRVVNAEHNQGRTLIHCSAGVGRTGTYICLDSMLEQMKEEGQVNVLGFIYQMRQTRIKMVQTPEQYQFIFDALLAAYQTGETTYDLTTFRRQLTALKKPKSGSKETGLARHFRNMSELRLKNVGSSAAGKLPENVGKNRYKDFIPTDRARPFLMTSTHEGDTNYINAHFIPGYGKKDRYIATQMPLPNTAADIWRLVYDQKATCIVMLNPMDEDNDTMCRYWPDEGSIEFGPLVVELLDTTTDKGVIKNTFSLQNKKRSEPARTVSQFQILDWPSDQEVPSSRQGILTLMELTQKWHEENPPIVVHCLDGLGRTSVYCTLMAMQEQFQEEKVVDVFQAVLRLRVVHPSMMYSLDHYAMCYDVFQANMDSSTIYENL